MLFPSEKPRLFGAGLTTGLRPSQRFLRVVEGCLKADEFYSSVRGLDTGELVFWIHGGPFSRQFQLTAHRTLTEIRFTIIVGQTKFEDDTRSRRESFTPIVLQSGSLPTFSLGGTTGLGDFLSMSPDSLFSLLARHLEDFALVEGAFLSVPV